MAEVREQILFDMKRRLTPNQKLMMIALRLNPDGLNRYDLQEEIGIERRNRRVMQRCLEYLVHSGLISASAPSTRRMTFFTLGPNA